MAPHIVVIEDDFALQDLYRLLFETEGYAVTISPTIYEDISTLAELHPSLIILDLMIGRKQDGWPFIQLLKSSPLTAHIPIIVATASADIEQEGKKASQIKGIPVIYKPFSIDAVLSLVRQLLNDETDAHS